MKKNRYIPYGYTCRNGKTTVDREEAETIRHIFDRYINGASLGEIAEELTQRNIPYTEKTSGWNKARISRIIENIKYIGSPDYDPIIDEEVYTAAINCKSARQCNLASSRSESINVIRNRVKCGKCGSPMIRKVISKNWIKERWDCHNAECNCQVRISDGMLIEKITILLNRIVENSELILPKSSAVPSTPDSPTVYRLKNELNQELSRQNPVEELILTKIREITAERYKSSNAKSALTAMDIQKKVQKMNRQDSFNIDYFKELIEYITLSDQGEITLHTKTHTTVTERSEND